MKNTISNTLDAKLFLYAVFISRLPNPVVALRFFLLRYSQCIFPFLSIFFANPKYTT